MDYKETQAKPIGFGGRPEIPREHFSIISFGAVRGSQDLQIWGPHNQTCC